MWEMTISMWDILSLCLPGPRCRRNFGDQEKCGGEGRTIGGRARAARQASNGTCAAQPADGQGLTFFRF